MQGAVSQGELTRFHARLKPRPAEAFLVLRAFALSLGPDVIERVDEGSATYLRRERPFLSVRSEKSRLQLLFPREVKLDDPSGRLLKRGDERYLPLEGPEGFDGHVQEFVRDSYAASRN